MTPFEAWWGHKPSVKHLRTFGCPAYAYISKAKRHKLDSKIEKCMFLGYSTCSKAYRIYNIAQKKMLVRRNVTFNESALGREGEFQLHRPTETVQLELGDGAVIDEAVVDKAEGNLPDKTYNSATNSEASDASGAEDTEGDAVALRRTTRANAGLLAQALEADVQVQEPSSWKEAMKSQQADEWKAAAQIEYKSLMNHGTWELVPLPPVRGSRLHTSLW